MQPNIAIQPVSLTDLPALLSIENLSFGPDAFNSRRLRYLISSPNVHFVLAMIDQQVAGYLILLTRKGSKRIRIYSIATSPWHRGMGVAQHLLNYTKTRAREQHMELINLEVREDNHKAIALYTKAGFVVKGKREDYYQPGVHGLVMYFYL